MLASLFHFFLAYSFLALTAIEGTLTPVYNVFDLSEKTKGVSRFESEITKKYVEEQMASASRLIWKNFDQKYPQNTKHVEEISLFIGHTPYNFLQYGTEINVDINYIEKYQGNDLRRDFTERLYYAMTNVWQWAEEDSHSIPPSLRGIASFIVWKSGYAPENWKHGKGKRWDESSDVTALFLDHCNSLRKDFIAKLNVKLKTGYKEEYFAQLLSFPLQKLWSDYKSEYS